MSKLKYKFISHDMSGIIIFSFRIKIKIQNFKIEILFGHLKSVEEKFNFPPKNHAATRVENKTPWSEGCKAQKVSLRFN